MPSPSEALLTTLTADYERLRAQKCRNQGGIEPTMLLDFLIYHGEHLTQQAQNTILTRAAQSDKDMNKLRLVINFAQRLADRKIGRHWGIDHRYRATPNSTDPDDYDRADVLSDSLIPALDYKLGQSTLRWVLHTWQVVCGVAFEHTGWCDAVTRDITLKKSETGEVLWKDTMTGEEMPEQQMRMLMQAQPALVTPERFEPAVNVQTQGEVCADIYDPFRVFVESSCRQIRHLGPGQRVYLADIRTHEWIADTFGNEAIQGLGTSKSLNIMRTQLVDQGFPTSGINLLDILPNVQGQKSKDDPDMCVLLTMYEAPSNKFPMGRRGFLVPEGKLIYIEANPYPEIPVIDYHWSAPTSTIWTTGFVRALVAMQKFLNKRYSQLGEAANAQLYELLLLGGNLKKGDIPADFHGPIEDGLGDNGEPLVKTVPRGQLPAFFPESIRLAMETMDMQGSSDLLSQRKFPGQIRGPLAIPMLQEILDSEDGPRFSHLAEQFALEKLHRINRVQQFYPPLRTLTYTGPGKRHEVLELHRDQILPATVQFDVSVDPSTLMPELSSMREARVRERFQWAPGIYTSPRTGTVDWSRIETDLRYNDTQRESKDAQGRKLARQLVKWARQGKLVVAPMPDPMTGGPKVDPKTGQPVTIIVDSQSKRPFMVLPFWPHGAMMDEYESFMTNTEFTEASAQLQRVLMALHGKHREALAQADQARQASIENKMIAGAVAQATQQTAAKTASMMADEVMSQMMAQRDEGSMGTGDPLAKMREAITADAMNNGRPGGPQPLPPGAGMMPRKSLSRPINPAQPQG